MRAKRVEGKTIGTLRTLRRVLVAALVVSCGGMAGGVQGGESHFLAYCDSNCDDGLDCISGVCTRGCLVDQTSCGDLSPNARCTDSSIEPGEVAVCDVGCESTADCRELGTGHRCVSGFCRAGTLPGATGRSCRVAYRDYPSGSTGVPSGNDCNTCRCDDGALVDCTVADCQTNGSIVACPENIRTDPFDLVDAYLAGDVMTVEIGHGGGCAPHDYELCYPLEFLQPDERIYAPVRLIHDAHGDTCEAYLQRTLTFDLLPFARYLTDIDPPNSPWGVSPPYEVDTALALYSFGRMSCGVSDDVAQQQATFASDGVDKACDSDDDCTLTSIDTLCSADCGAVVSKAGELEMQRAIQNIDATVCQNFEGDGCTKVIPPCVPPPPIACVNGTCAFTP